MRVSEETDKFKQRAKQNEILSHRSGENPFQHFEDIELAVEMIRSKIMNCLNASDDTLQDVQKNIDTFERDFEARVTTIRNRIEEGIEMGRGEKSDQLTRQVSFSTSENCFIVENLYGNLEDCFSVENDRTDKPHLKQMGSIVDRIHDVRLTKLEVLVRKTKWCLLEVKRYITELNWRIMLRAIETQRISYKNVMCLKDMLDHLKSVQNEQKDTAWRLTETKTEQIKKLCGSLCDKTQKYLKVVNSCESSSSPSTVLRVKKIKIPQLFLLN